jgi:hypothetical protein
MKVKKIKIHNFEPILAYDHDPAKVPKFQNFGHDGMYSIDWKFHDDLKSYFTCFSCPVTGQQPKNVLPISVVTRNFLFILIFGFSAISWWQNKVT